MAIHIDKTSFESNGFILVRGALSDSDFFALETKFLDLANARIGKSFSSINDPELIKRICYDRSLETYFYNEIRQYRELVDLSLKEKSDENYSYITW